MSAEVSDLDARLVPIAALCEGQVSYKKEGWRELVHMERLRLLVGGKQRIVDAVLCLNHDNPTYPTKLYLSENVGGGLNWNEQAYLLGRNWFTFSWRDVRPDQPQHEILAAHLAALNPCQAGAA
jgi:hypothetical protein